MRACYLYIAAPQNLWLINATSQVFGVKVQSLTTDACSGLAVPCPLKAGQEVGVSCA
jgi:hypothetical protein